MAIFEAIGHWVIKVLDYVGGVTLLLMEALGYVSRGAVRLGLTINQMAFLGVNSIIIVVIN